MENNTKLLEQIKNAPKEIKDFMLSILLSSGMAMKQVEDNMKTLNNGSIDTERTQDSLGSLSEAFLAGKQNKQTKEYVQRFYKILGEADKKAKEMYGNTYFTNNEGYNEYKQTLGSGGPDKLGNQKQYITEQFEKNNLQHVVSNSKSLINHDYIQTGEAPRFLYSIKLFSKYNIDFLEQSLKVVQIFDINGRDKKVTMILEPNNLNQLDAFLKYFRLNQNEIVSLYAIEYYAEYKKNYVSIDNFISADINNESKLILTFNGKIV